MSKVADQVLMITLVILLVTVLGAVEGGANPGVGKWSFLLYCLPVPCSQSSTIGTTSHTTILHTSSSHTTQTRHSSTTQVRTTSVMQTTRSSTSSSSVTKAAGAPTLPPLGLTEWYVWIPMALLVITGSAYILIRRQKPKVLNLGGALRDLEEQRKYFTGSWSMKMRNAALLKYYLLMAQICSKMGIVNQMEETPHHFIGRAASELKVESESAEEFANVVDRAHYGVELSQEEVQAVSGFMDSFTRALSGKINLG